MNRRAHFQLSSMLAVICLAMPLLAAIPTLAHPDADRHSHPPGYVEDVVKDAAEEITAPIKPVERSLMRTCAHLPPRVAVAGYVYNTECQMVGTDGIGRMDLIKRGFIDAVDIWSYVNGGLEICFRNTGWLVFLDSAFSPRIPVEMESYQRDGMTCGAIDSAGTVALLASAAHLDAAPQPADSAPPPPSAIPLAQCQIKLQETLFLRAEPAGEIIGLVWQYSEVPVFEISGDWYKVEFEGDTGYISRHYRRVLHGACD